MIISNVYDWGGIEPPLLACPHTNSRLFIIITVRDTRIELVPLAWEANILPLYESRSRRELVWGLGNPPVGIQG